MKKCVSLIAMLLVILCLTACSEDIQETQAPPRDADYLYGWLTEHGTLVGGTCLQYSEIDDNGTKFILSYDTSYGWKVEYSATDSSWRTINTTLFLFCDSSKSLAQISVYGFGTYSEYYRTLGYFHKPNVFTKKSPIELGELNGSTVYVPDAEKELIAQILKMNTICEENSQKNLCVILDWLKDSFCPTANMTMADFGYDNYK